MLASGLTPSAALAAGMARSSSATQGCDTGVVFNLLGRSSLTILPASGDVGAQYTPAAGWAQAILYHQQVLKQDEWQGSIAVAHGGDSGDLVYQRS
jgi:2-oxoisovalerate dehydrogenase E1 component